VLCYGAMIRSGIFGVGAMDTQKAIVAELLSNMKTRSYLPLLTYKFFTEGINSVSDFYFSCVKKKKQLLFVFIYTLFYILVK